MVDSARGESCSIIIQQPEDSFHALSVAKNLAGSCGFSNFDQVMIATVVSELATNIIRYASSGEINIKTLIEDERCGIEIISSDNGPGIDDIEKAMLEGFSTMKNSAGLGLSTVKNNMDEFFIRNKSNPGLEIITRKWIKVSEY